MFTKWDENENYDHLDSRYHHARGTIPVGVVVQFADGSTGRVLQGNSNRSLVSYRPSKSSGCSEARDWFDNKELRLAG